MIVGNSPLALSRDNTQNSDRDEFLSLEFNDLHA